MVSLVLKIIKGNDELLKPFDKLSLVSVFVIRVDLFIADLNAIGFIAVAKSLKLSKFSDSIKIIFKALDSQWAVRFLFYHRIEVRGWKAAEQFQ